MAKKIALKSFEKLVVKELNSITRTASVLASKHFKDSFVNQGFTDSTLEAWPDRKVDPKNAKGNGSGRGILVKTGALKRAIVTKVVGFSVQVSNEMPYAEIHNEGGTITASVQVKEHTRKIYRSKKSGGKSKRKSNTTVKSHTRKINLTIPKRQFIGNSVVLNEKIIAEANKKFTDLFTSLQLIK